MFTQIHLCFISDFPVTQIKRASYSYDRKINFNISFKLYGMTYIAVIRIKYLKKKSYCLVSPVQKQLFLLSEKLVQVKIISFDRLSLK